MALDRELMDLKEQLAALEGKLETLNAQPNTVDLTKSVAAGDEKKTSAAADKKAQMGLLAADEKLALIEKFKQFQPAQLERMIAVQMAKGAKQGMGVPLATYLSGNNNLVQKFQEDPDLTKALDISGATPLIRQDLEPLIYALFVKNFPFFDRLRKKPSNGNVHAYNQQTAYGTAAWIAELGTVSDHTGTYARQTTNIAIAATRRGIGLKAQFAVQHGGMSYQPEAEEIRGGVRGITALVQKGIFQGNASDAASSGASDERGAYDANSFDGLRKLLKDYNSGSNCFNKAATDDFVTTVNTAATLAINNGGNPSVLVCRVGEHAAIMNEMNPQQRWVDKQEIMPGVEVPALTTVAGSIPILRVPGDSIGTYTFSGSTVADMYLLDEEGLAIPWLGSDTPTVLEIPIGTNAILNHLYIIFWMGGFEFATPNFQTKIRV